MITNGILLDKYIELVKDNDMDLLISLAKFHFIISETLYQLLKISPRNPKCDTTSPEPICRNWLQPLNASFIRIFLSSD